MLALDQGVEPLLARRTGGVGLLFEGALLVERVSEPLQVGLFCIGLLQWRGALLVHGLGLLRRQPRGFQRVLLLRVLRL